MNDIIQTMKITDISVQAKNPNRVNISVDGKYRFSLDIAQVIDLGLKKGQEIDEAALAEYEQESAFGKLYARALEYCLMRPHSAREVRDYLWKKTRATKYKSRRTGQIMEREGVSTALTERVYARLEERGYIDDEAFARYWVENRNQIKGASRRKLSSELMQKGVSSGIIEAALSASERDDTSELAKIIAKKRNRYPDEQKLIAYLARQGFSYDDIKSALADGD
ncbi:MAG TPA: RecX family transcriptional regulator [Patescibacteria group bacterium]|jgi:regulatory protein|nr:RecX family transcriptional regulator [Patescibacteria group bacterium]